MYVVVIGLVVLAVGLLVMFGGVMKGDDPAAPVSAPRLICGSALIACGTNMLVSLALLRA